MQKILFIVTQSEFGGAQRYIYEIVSHLDPQKYDILVAAGSPSQVLRGKIWEGKGDEELFRKLEKVGIRWLRLKHMKRTPWPWQMILAIREIFNLLKRERPDVLFLCSTTAGLLGSIAAFFYKRTIRTSRTSRTIRTIYRIGGWAFKDPRNKILNLIILLAEKITAPLKDRIIVNSEEDLKLAIKYKIAPAGKLAKIYNGVDIKALRFLSLEEARDYLSSKLKTQNSKPQLKTKNFKVIGCVANFYRTKGLEYLIKAAYILNTKYSILNTKYLIIGEGKERPKLEGLIKKYGLEEKVFLVGRIPNASKYLKAFDVFVLPSLKEGFPWIILEAATAKIPIIATNVGALPEIIEDKKEGILIPPKNSQILAEKICWLLDHLKEAEDMGIRAKKRIKKEFTLEKMVKETEKILIMNHYPWPPPSVSNMVD